VHDTKKEFVSSMQHLRRNTFRYCALLALAEISDRLHLAGPILREDSGAYVAMK
jgi:hypothetical protein